VARQPSRTHAATLDHLWGGSRATPMSGVAAEPPLRFFFFFFFFLTKFILFFNFFNFLFLSIFYIYLYFFINNDTYRHFIRADVA